MFCEKIRKNILIPNITSLKSRAKQQFIVNINTKKVFCNFSKKKVVILIRFIATKPPKNLKFPGLC